MQDPSNLLMVQRKYLENICGNGSTNVLPMRPHGKLDLHINGEYHVYLALVLNAGDTQVAIYDLLIDPAVQDIFTIEVIDSQGIAFYITFDKQNCDQGRSYLGAIQDIAYQPLVYWYNGSDTPEYGSFGTFVFEPSGQDLDVDWPIQNLNTGKEITGEVILLPGSVVNSCITFSTTCITNPGAAELLQITSKNGGDKGSVVVLRGGG